MRQDKDVKITLVLEFFQYLSNATIPSKILVDSLNYWSWDIACLAISLDWVSFRTGELSLVKNFVCVSFRIWEISPGWSENKWYLDRLVLSKLLWSRRLLHS